MDLMIEDIYFDNSATTRIFDHVIDEMNFLYRRVYGNPSSLHRKGIQAEKYIDEARKNISSSLRCDEKEIIFTSGGTEANNLAIFGYLRKNKRKGNHILTTKIEHPSILEVYEYLGSNGYHVEYVNVNEEGLVLIDDLKSKLTKDTALVSFTYVNSEIGTILNVKEIVKALNKKDNHVVLHIDAVQAYGKININPKKLGIDLMSISSHKIHGPKGVGGLFVNKSIRIEPIIIGGGQEENARSGTENTMGVHGFKEASKIMHENIDKNNKNIKSINSYFRENLIKNFDNVHINSPESGLANILNVSFEGVRAEILLHSLEDKGIFISTGSACSSRKKKRSNVLLGINLKNSLIDSAIRFSFSKDNTLEEVKIVIEVLKEIVPKINFGK